MQVDSTRILGIVGGTGPESTVDYYRSLIAAWRQQRPDGSLPRLIINSIEGGGLWRLLEAANDRAVVAQLRPAVAQLSAAGAGMVILASNTVHTVFDEVERAAPVPMMSIVTETVAAIRRLGLQRPALLGTRFIMESDLYVSPLTTAGIEVVVPEPEERKYLHDRYVDELIVGTVSARTRERTISIISAMQRRAAIDGVVLAGTELGLLLPGSSYHGLPVVDSTKVHVESAIRWLLAG